MVKKLFSPIVILLIVSLFPVLSLLINPGLPILHDGQDHVARIANFYASISEGNLVPRWAANLNWGYGHPVLMFLYPFPSYIASVIHAVGFSFVDSTKLVFALTFILSGLFMFLWMNAAWGPIAGFVGALLYQFAPYRFIDMHVRGAIGEHVAFVFPPLVLYFLLKKKWVGLSLSLGALILSHNAVSLLFLPVIALYFVYLFFSQKTNKERISFILNALMFGVLGFGVAGFFWIPALFEGKFTLRDIVTAGQVKEFVPWNWFVYSSWNYGFGPTFTKSLGLSQWAGIALSIWYLFVTKKKKNHWVLRVSFVVLVASLFMMTTSSSFLWRSIKLLEKFQFPWRFLSLSVFIAAVIGGIGTSLMLKGKRIVLIVFCVFIVVSTFYMWHPKGFVNQQESFYTGIYKSTTDTGESSPIWSVRAMEYTSDNPLELIDGDATITNVNRKTTIHEYTVSVRKPSLMLENTLYFPGWMIYINGVQTDIEWQNPDYRGLLTFRMTPGANQSVKVVFGDTTLRRIANILSIGSFIILGAVGGLWLIKRRSQ